MSILPSGRFAAGVRALCEAHEEFPRFVLTAPPAVRGALALVLALAAKSGGPEPRVIAAEVMAGRVRELVAALRGRCPEGLAGVLRRLPPRPMAAARYLRLLDLLDEPQAAKCLRHGPRITPALLDTLAKLEPAFRRPKIAAHLAAWNESEMLAYGLAVIRRLRPEAADRDLAASLDRLVRSDEFSAVTAWVEHWCRRLPIPPAPWAGSKRLRPLGTVSELRRTGAEACNCLGHMVLPAVTGQRAFYRWSSRQITVASLDRDVLLGWVVGELGGPANEKVPAERRAAIIAEFAAAGFTAFPNRGEAHIRLGFGLWA